MRGLSTNQQREDNAKKTDRANDADNKCQKEGPTIAGSLSRGPARGSRAWLNNNVDGALRAGGAFFYVGGQDNFSIR